MYYPNVIFMAFISYSSAQVATEFPEDPPLTEGRECRHSSGIAGTCTDYENCPRSSFRNLLANTCGFIGQRPFICCPKTAGVDGPDGGDKFTFIGVKEPEVNFGCGVGKRMSHTNQFINFTGGVLPERGDWPWAALVGIRLDGTKRDWICPGSLINRRYVLSAARCVINASSPDTILLGEHDKSLRLAPQEFRITRFIIHPEYKPPVGYNDLVLFQLDKDVILQSTVKPICLPWGNFAARDLVGSTVTTAGWRVKPNRRESSFMEADIGVFDASLCNERYSGLPFYGELFPEGITDRFYICAGNTTHSVDASCAGDTGGPLTFRDDGTTVLVGVTNIGYGCGSTKYPVLYINLMNLNYLQWIKDEAF